MKKVYVEEVSLLPNGEVEQIHRSDEFDSKDLTERQVIFKAKKAFGWSGIRCNRTDKQAASLHNGLSIKYHTTLCAVSSKYALLLYFLY
jgi:hypothetical protein